MVACLSVPELMLRFNAIVATLRGGTKGTCLRMENSAIMNRFLPPSQVLVSHSGGAMGDGIKHAFFSFLWYLPHGTKGMRCLASLICQCWTGASKERDQELRNASDYACSPWLQDPTPHLPPFL